MPTTQLPLMKGLGKDYSNADYVDLLPVNMLATPKEVLGSAGYMRSFPGIKQLASFAGTSRGAEYNTVNNRVYRVMGNMLYVGESSVGLVAGDSRVSFAHSSVSQAVAADGAMQLFRYDGEVKTLSNWPEKVITTPESDTLVIQWTSTSGDAGGNQFFVDRTNFTGKFVIAMTAILSNGLTGEEFKVTETQWNTPVSQAESSTRPYFTNVIVTGSASESSTVRISYTLNKPSGSTSASNVSRIVVTQHIDEVSTTYAQYDIGKVRDICRLRGRYIWVKDGTDTFGVTDLEDESHPDQFRPFYRAESQPDGIQGCAVWRDFVIMFGTSSIEYFSLSGATDSSSAIYVAQPSLMVSKGIAGTYCKSPFAGSFAFISHPATGSPSVYVIDSGQLQNIASASVEKILRGYSLQELSAAVMESLRFDSHELLLIHLPRDVLCFDSAASSGGPQWTKLVSGYSGLPHSPVDYVYSNNSITAGDKVSPVTGELTFNSSSQYGSPSEHILYTPMFKADNARVFDFELESSAGVAQSASRMFISATSDGINYGQEKSLESERPFVYDRRVLWRRVGRVRKNIGFKVRIITESPVTLSGCSVRIE